MSGYFSDEQEEEEEQEQMHTSLPYKTDVVHEAGEASTERAVMEGEGAVRARS